MISILLWFAALSSGSVLCAAIWKRRYEEILPITCSIIVMVLFLCDIAGSLFWGGYWSVSLGLRLISRQRFGSSGIKTDHICKKYFNTGILSIHNYICMCVSI